MIQVHHAYLDAIVAAVLRPWLKARVVARLAGGGPAGDMARLRRLGIAWLALPLIKRLDGWIVVSEQMRQELLAAGFDAQRISVIPNGVDTERFAPDSYRVPKGHVVDNLSLPNPVRSAQPIIVSVGRLSREKGMDVLLAAWPSVQQRIPGARLRIVGDGPQRAELVRLATTLKLNGSVEWIGETADVAAQLRHSTLFVLPSRSEGMPNALLEAMAAELPCVATRVGGVTELLHDGDNGRVVEPDSPAALAHAIVELLQSPIRARTLAVAARQTVVTRHDLTTMVDRYLALYSDLSGRA